MIKGIHHISMKCRPEELDKVKSFYMGVLGMSLCREWDGGVMFDTGNGLVEIFTNGTEDMQRQYSFTHKEMGLISDKGSKRYGFSCIM